MKKRILAGLLAIIVVVGGVFWTTRKPHAEHKQNPVVVASLDFYGEMARAVGGKYAEVTTVINSTEVDPHDYEPTPSVGRKYAQADIVISNGAGYDSWSTKFARQAGAKQINVAQITHYQTGANEHLWFKPETPRLVVHKLVRDLAHAAPAHTQYYRARGKQYLTKLKQLENKRTALKEKIHGIKYLATEPVYANTMQALGAKALLPGFARAVEEETDPSASDIKQWHELIRTHKVSLVINNPQNSSRVVRSALQYARVNGVPIVNVTETMPGKLNYIEWQEQLLQQVSGAVK